MEDGPTIQQDLWPPAHMDLKEQAEGPHMALGEVATFGACNCAILYHSVIFKSCSEKGSPAFPREASAGRQGSPPQRERWRAGKSLLTSGAHLFLPGVL